jgi:hypothetical protein
MIGAYRRVSAAVTDQRQPSSSRRRFCSVAEAAVRPLLLLRELKDPERKPLTGPDGPPRRPNS